MIESSSRKECRQKDSDGTTYIFFFLNNASSVISILISKNKNIQIRMVIAVF